MSPSGFPKPSSNSSPSLTSTNPNPVAPFPPILCPLRTCRHSFGVTLQYQSRNPFFPQPALISPDPPSVLLSLVRMEVNTESIFDEMHSCSNWPHTLPSPFVKVREHAVEFHLASSILPAHLLDKSPRTALCRPPLFQPVLRLQR